jgi:predicted peptidase
MVSWNDKYQEFAAWKSISGNPNSASSFLNFRVIFPPGYNKLDVNKKYPMIIMLHGAGESGRVWQGRFDYDNTDPRFDNNSNQLLNGGNEHQLAVNKPSTDSKAFPGIVVFPQVNSSGSWSDGWQNGALTQNQNYVIEIIDYMIANYNADINRIIIHGLSNGARGVWDTSTKRPDLFAAVLAMSGIPYELDSAAKVHTTTPLRLYQGGLDVNPSPSASQLMNDKLGALGGTPEYYVYPTLGHNTWTTAYATADFFSWMLNQDKRKIYIFGGSTQLCDGATKKLGFSAGFTAYRWFKDGIIIPSPNNAVFNNQCTWRIYGRVSKT